MKFLKLLHPVASFNFCDVHGPQLICKWFCSGIPGDPFPVVQLVGKKVIYIFSASSNQCVFVLETTLFHLTPAVNVNIFLKLRGHRKMGDLCCSRCSHHKRKKQECGLWLQEHLDLLGTENNSFSSPYNSSIKTIFAKSDDGCLLLHWHKIDVSFLTHILLKFSNTTLCRQWFLAGLRAADSREESDIAPKQFLSNMSKIFQNCLLENVHLQSGETKKKKKQKTNKQKQKNQPTATRIPRPIACGQLVTSDCIIYSSRIRCPEFDKHACTLFEMDQEQSKTGSTTQKTCSLLLNQCPV